LLYPEKKQLIVPVVPEKFSQVNFNLWKTNRLCNESTLNCQKIKLDEFEKLLEDREELQEKYYIKLPLDTIDRVFDSP